jgi:riboflavin kinase / FMN adenylyltransferase
MRVLTGRAPAVAPASRAVVTVGVFDGVHRAHQRLIRSTVRLAGRRGASAVVVTFDPDPHAVLDPEHAPPALMPLDARLAKFRDLGVDAAWIIPFTKSFSAVRAETFIRDLLVGRLHAAALIVGETFAFGRGRRGNMRLLRRLGPVAGMRIVSVPEVRSSGAPISSSRIRRLIASGKLAGARQLLGRPPELYGTVVRGAGRGRRLGFPTANIRLRASTLPPQGVYAVRLHAGARGPIAGVMNLGIRPTFGPGPLVCEVHLLGFSGRLNGRSVSVSLLGRLRGERCFPSPEALVVQVRRDIRRARRLFARSR